MKSPSQVRIRRATESDAEVVMAMVGEIAAHQGQLESVTVTSGRWQSLLSTSEVIVLLAERDQIALGYVSAVRRLHLWSDRDVLGLDDLYVRDHARDEGVGRMLMIELASLAAPEALTITWGVGPENVAAQRFYDRLGATLRTKVVAGWSPERYGELL